MTIMPFGAVTTAAPHRTILWMLQVKNAKLILDGELKDNVAGWWFGHTIESIAIASGSAMEVTIDHGLRGFLGSGAEYAISALRFE